MIDLCTDICKRYGKTKLLWFADKEKTLAYNPAADEMIITVHRWFANTLPQFLGSAAGGAGDPRHQYSGQ